MLPAPLCLLDDYVRFRRWIKALFCLIEAAALTDFLSFLTQPTYRYLITNVLDPESFVSILSKLRDMAF